jgi:polysaccharide export outer membrane protein
MFRKILFLVACSQGLLACTNLATPQNRPGSVYANQQSWNNGPTELPQCHAATAPAELASDRYIDPATLQLSVMQLAAGDRLRLAVSGDKDLLSGTYIVESNGTLQLPQIAPVRMAGRTMDDARQDIERQLIDAMVIRPLSNGVRLHIIEQAPVPVSVSGAVFDPGMVRIGERSPEVRNVNLGSAVSGDLNPGRMLSTALRAAGGVRPDADIGGIYLQRADHWTRVDMRGALDGSFANDIPLNAGDRILVGSVGCLQPALVRPSPVTAPGIRVFLSNLSRPAMHNAGSAIGKDTTSLPYGTRLLQGLVTANCVGGSAMNAGRSAVLISRNPTNGQSIVVERSIEQLVRAANRDEIDPYLMPGDAIACYDSAAMNVRDLVATISEAASPFVLFKSLSN